MENAGSKWKTRGIFLAKMRSQNFEFNGKVTAGMGETLPSVAEYFDVSILCSLNFTYVVAK